MTTTYYRLIWDDIQDGPRPITIARIITNANGIEVGHDVMNGEGRWEETHIISDMQRGAMEWDLVEISEDEAREYIAERARARGGE